MRSEQKALSVSCTLAPSLNWRFTGMCQPTRDWGSFWALWSSWHGACCLGGLWQGLCVSPSSPCPFSEGLCSPPPPLPPQLWERKTQRQGRCHPPLEWMNGSQHLRQYDLHSGVCESIPSPFAFAVWAWMKPKVTKSFKRKCWISLMAESKSPDRAWIHLQMLIHQILMLAVSKPGWPWGVWTESQTLQVFAYFKPCPFWGSCLITKWQC